MLNKEGLMGLETESSTTSDSNGGSKFLILGFFLPRALINVHSMAGKDRCSAR
jgi:hypothetical protein